jgi:hypothetical protein
MKKGPCAGAEETGRHPEEEDAYRGKMAADCSIGRCVRLRSSLNERENAFFDMEFNYPACELSTHFPAYYDLIDIYTYISGSLFLIYFLHSLPFDLSISALPSFFLFFFLSRFQVSLDGGSRISAALFRNYFHVSLPLARSRRALIVPVREDEGAISAQRKQRISRYSSFLFPFSSF